MKLREIQLIVCLLIALVSAYVIVYEKPNVSSSAHEYQFYETSLKTDDEVLIGSHVTYTDAHCCNSVKIVLNRVKPIESFEVFLDGDEIKIIYKESEIGLKKDRMFHSHLVEEFDLHLDHIKVYNKNKRVFFVQTDWFNN